MGNGASNVSLLSHFRAWKGNIEVFRHISLFAMLSLDSTAHLWPIYMERNVIYVHLNELLFFLNCV